MSSEELKPCPFCLREAQQTASSGLVSCAYEDCPAFLLAVPAADWNRRAQLAAIQQAKGEEVEVVGYRYMIGCDSLLDHCKPSVAHDALMTVAQHQRITAAMAAEVERLRDRNESLEQQAAHNYEVARLAADQVSALRAELAAVKGQEAVPVLAAYECCHCGAPTGAPKPFSAFVVCPACGEKTAATRAARYAPASPDVEVLVKALEDISRSETLVGDVARSALSTWRHLKE